VCLIGANVSLDNARYRAGARFPDTSWGLVLAAGDRAEARARDAYATLCRQYWMPIYASLRRQGFDASDAEDLTQGFFLHLIAGGTVSRADPARGRFRSFLHGALARFVASDRERERALKRGGDRLLVPFDKVAAEAEVVGSDDGTPPQLQFDRRWARTLVANAFARLAAEYAESGDSALFDALRPMLSGREMPTYAALAPRLGRNEGAIKTAVHRLRRRFRDILRGEVAQTVAAPEEVDDELAYLRNVLGSESETSLL
jgi:RNA polymerase sigma-70 factor (ECF subfamily)